MTRNEALAEVREMRPNEYQDELLLKWLDELEERIYRELLDGYIVPEMGEDLIAPDPYSGMYRWWLVANIDLANGEMDRYNNYLSLFNSLWDEYGRMISRRYRREKPARYRRI